MSDRQTRRRLLGSAARLGLSATGLMLFSSCGAAPWGATRAKVGYRIGVLVGNTEDTFRANSPFVQRLAELGYIDGDNITLEVRSPGSDQDWTHLAAELVRLDVDVIYANPRVAALAAASATSKIPIVLGGIIPDPIEAGLVASLARPGGNVTGVTDAPPETHLKRLELIVDALPGLSRVGVWGGIDEPPREQWEKVARSLGVALHPIALGRAATADGTRAAFEAAAREHVDALLRTASSSPPPDQRLIGELAGRSGLPTMFDQRGYVAGGALMAYASNAEDRARRAADYVDRILRGAAPSDLPVEQPTRYDLFINSQAAADLGITIPESLLAQATEVLR